MKIKNMMVVSIFLLAVLTLGAVSATDDLTVNETSIDDGGADTGDIGGDDDNGEYAVDDENNEDTGDDSYDDGDDQDPYEDEYKDDAYTWENRLEGDYIVGNARFGVGFQSDYPGNVTITIDDNLIYNQKAVYYSWDDESPKGGNFINLDDYDLTYGEHTYLVKYTGNSDYRGETWEGIFTYTYYKIEVPETVILGNGDDYEAIIIYLPEDATGNINVLIDNRSIYSKSAYEEGSPIYIYPENLTFTSHDYTITYSDGNYENFTQSGSFDMTYYFSVYAYEYITIGENCLVYISLPGDITSVPTVKLGDKTYEVEMEYGYGELTLSDFTLGENTVSVSYGDEKYPLRTEEITVNVDYLFNIPNTVTFNSEDAIELGLPENAKGNLVVNINGEEKKIRLVNGSAKFLFNEYPTGSYEVTASYDGDDYEVYERNEYLSITPKINVPPYVWINGEYAVTVEVPEDSASNLTVTITTSNYRPDDDYWDDEYEAETIKTIYDGSVSGIVNIDLPVSDLEADKWYKVKFNFNNESYDLYNMKVKSQSPVWNFEHTLPENVMPYDGGDWEYDFRLGGLSDATGLITCYIDGVEVKTVGFDYDWSGYIFRGVYSQMSFDQHTWKLVFHDDLYYENASAEGKINITWFYFPKEVSQGSYAEVGLGYDKNNLVTLYIDGNEYASSFYSNPTFALTNLSYGEHTYKIQSLGDNDLSAEGTFKVVSYMTINDNGVYSDKYPITIELAENATGSVTLTINNKNYTSQVKNNCAKFEIPDLTIGKYVATVLYSGDENNPQLTREYEIEIYGYSVVSNYVDGEKLESFSLVLPEDARGSMKIIINEDEENPVLIALENGKAKYEIKNLSYGHYEFHVTYTGDDYEVDSIWEYIGFGPTIDTPGRVPISSESYVFIEIADATGKIIINLDGVKYAEESIASGSVNVTLPKNLTLGEHYVTIEYVGDEDYQKYFNYYDEIEDYVPDKYYFDVTPLNDNYVDYDEKTLYIELPEDAKGNLTVKVRSKVYKKLETSGSINVSFDELKPGYYIVSFNYTDEKYGSYYWYESEMTLHINAKPTITVETPESEIPTVIVKMEEDAEGAVAIRINDKDYVQTLEKGMATFEIPGLPNGLYDISVRYSGHDLYDDANLNDTVRIGPKELIDSNLTVKVSDINVGQNAVICINMNETVTTTVLVKVGDANYTAEITEGKGNVSVPALVADTYEVAVYFDGNDDFKNATETATFTVSKLEAPEIIITPGEAIEGSDLEIDVSAGDATGNVIINGKTIALSNGKAHTTIENPSAGNLTVNVNYEGNEKYLTSSKSLNITVQAKNDAELAAGADDVTVSDDAAVAISFNKAITGNITVNGSNAVMGNGIALFEIGKLPAGTYTYIVKYEGDKYFNAAEKTVTFTVFKLTPEITVSTGEAIEGSDLEVSVEIAGATGNVKINGENIALDEGKASTTIKKLESGELTVNIVYDGDDIYLNSSKTETVTVKAKGDAGLTASAGDIEVGDTAVIIIEINKDTTGKVTVNDEEVTVTDGKAAFEASELTEGEYTYTVKFEGDKYFNNASTTVTVKVNKKELPADADPFKDDKANETKTSNNPTYTINLPSDATGNLTVTIGGKTYTKELVNGSATIEVDNLPAGSYEATIAYSGDAKYAPIVKKENVTVKVDPKVVMKQTTALYTAKYSVTVYGDDGNISPNTDVVFYINGKKVKTVKTNAKGVATFNIPSKYIPKKYTIKATALGKSASKKVTVKQILTVKKVTVKKSAKKLVLTATLAKVDKKYLKGKTITFKFNGKSYMAKTDKKGVAKVTIKKSVLKKLKVGKKITYQATYLKNTVKKSVKVKK